MQKEIQNHDEDVNVSSLLTEHRKKEKFRDSCKDLKFIKVRNALGRHTYGNQVRPSKVKIIYILWLFSKFTKYNVIHEVISSQLYVQRCL